MHAIKQSMLHKSYLYQKYSNKIIYALLLKRSSNCLIYYKLFQEKITKHVSIYRVKAICKWEWYGTLLKVCHPEVIRSIQKIVACNQQTLIESSL